MDDTVSVITDVTDVQVETVDVNLDTIENWNELELREAQVSITLVFLTVYGDQFFTDYSTIDSAW